MSTFTVAVLATVVLSGAANAQTDDGYLFDDDAVGIWAFEQYPLAPSPASLGDSPSEPPSQEDLWSQYCGGIGGFNTTSSVGFVDAGAVSQSELQGLIASGRTDLNPGGDYRFATVGCASASTGWSGQLFIVPAGVVPAVDPVVLRNLVRARMVVPDPVVATSPPHDRSGYFGIVGIPTWFWLEEWGELGPESASAGGLSVSVVGRPILVTWSLGDGSELVCEGPGVAWRQGMAEDATDCSYTYTSSSADQPGASYELSATLAWEFEWWVNGVSQGTFGAGFVTTTPFAYQVGEIQALES